jgi:hypothetical protein
MKNVCMPKYPGSHRDINNWSLWGHIIAKAATCQLPTTATWVRSQVRSYGICGGQSGTGVGFL